ncbi:MAG: tetratricopeptide repeat protein [Kiritimatiellia bacterium]
MKKNKEQIKPAGPGAVAEISMAEAHKRTRMTSLAFLALMVVFLLLAWWMWAEGQKHKDSDKDFMLLSLDTNTVVTDRRGFSATNLLPLETQELLDPGAWADGKTAQLDPQKMTAAMGEMRKAQDFLRAGNYDMAIMHTRKAMDIQPEMDAALRMLGVIYIQRGQFDQAISVLEKALAKDAYNPETLSNLSTAYLQRGNREKAEELLLTAVQIKPDYYVGYVNLGLLFLASSQYESAAEYFEQAMSGIPENAALRNNYAVALLRLGRFEEAREHLNWLISHYPEIPESYFNMAITHVYENDANSALAWISKGAERCSPSALQEYLRDSDFNAIREHPGFLAVSKGIEPSLPQIPGAPPN